MNQADGAASPPAPNPGGQPPGAHLPRPTGWPMVLAVGIAMIMAGLAVSPLFSLGGVIIFIIALTGWIRELRRG